MSTANPEPGMIPDPGELRIRNQRYQPWPEIVLGMFLVTSLVGMCGVVRLERLSMINFVLAGGVVGLLAVVLFEWLLPRLGSVRELQLGNVVQTAPIVWRYPVRSVTRISFADDPEEDYAERNGAARLYEATIEMEPEKPFRMIVDESDAEQLRRWAIARGIIVGDRREDFSSAAQRGSGA